MTNEAVEILRSIADPTRLRMVAHLADKKEVSCGDLSAFFSYLSQPTLCHHYKKLTDVGLLKTRKEGTRLFYSLNAGLLRDVGFSIKALKNLR